MKNNLIAFIIFSFVFTSCEKVIDVDLNKAKPQIVIEANLQEGMHDFKVHITQTSSYFDNQASPAVVNALVELHDASANFALRNIGDGWYQLDNYKAVSNSVYDLKVTVDGKSYNASSSMPSSVSLDTLTYDYMPGALGDDAGYQITCSWKDPVNIGNYYRLISSKNNEPNNTSSNLIVLEDRLSDGLYVNVPLFSNVYQLNDTVSVSLLSIDKKAYEYFNTLSQIVMNNSGTAPANPNTNFSGGALGYFAATSASTKTLVIK